MTDKDKIIEILEERSIKYKEDSSFNKHCIELKPDLNRSSVVKFWFDAADRLIEINVGVTNCKWLL